MDRLWALRSDAFAELRTSVEAVGIEVALDKYRARWAALEAATPGFANPRRGGAVAVIPIYGMLTPRGGMGTSTKGLIAAVRQAAADGSVGSILLEVDSPGGEVYGIPEAADEIRQTRRQKPVVAIADSQASSSAYWLASQADELWVTPSGDVGSIGVYALHFDLSEAAKQAGVKVSYVAAGRYKVDGNPYSPLSDEHRAALQQRADAVYADFIQGVKLGRRVTIDVVRNGFGEGRPVQARPALAERMVDAIGTLDGALRRAAQLASQPRPQAPATLAEAQGERIRRSRDW